MNDSLSKDKIFYKKNICTSSIILNRPGSINSIDFEMMRKIKDSLLLSRDDKDCKAVLLYGTGSKGFCAGGDIKSLAASILNNNFDEVMDFLKLEYETDLLIHRFTKPVIIIADGITMGGGLGLAAGADIVLATERSVMAMPETRIGFFPDVGSTGWMFSKCPEGYPEFLGLTGYELRGAECTRVGLATHFIKSGDVSKIIKSIENADIGKTLSRQEALDGLYSIINPFLENVKSDNTEMDDWVRNCFYGKSDLYTLIKDLAGCDNNNKLCEEAFIRISERSPSALVLTLMLLQNNKGLPVENVFANDLKSAEYMAKHHDYYEGIRARLIDKDDDPHWDPISIDKVSIKLKL